MKLFKWKKEKEQQIEMQKQQEIQHSRKIKIFSAVIACLAVCVLVLGGTTASAVREKNLLSGQLEEQTGQYVEIQDQLDALTVQYRDLRYDYGQLQDELQILFTYR
mgnify:FL=1